MPPSPELGMGIDDMIDVSDIDLGTAGVDDVENEGFVRHSVS